MIGVDQGPDALTAWAAMVKLPQSNLTNRQARLAAICPGSFDFILL